MDVINFKLPNFKKIFYIIVLVVLSILALTSCSANWHLRKAISKDPSILVKGEKIIVDTVVVTRERMLTDTVVLNNIDSVTITKDNVITKLWRVHDTIRVTTICPSDTITLYETIECPPQIVYEESVFKGKNIMLAILIVAVGAIVYAFFSKGT